MFSPIMTHFSCTHAQNPLQILHTILPLVEYLKLSTVDPGIFVFQGSMNGHYILRAEYQQRGTLHVFGLACDDEHNLEDSDLPQDVQH